MKIAVFHNVPGGGAKRAILEMARRLAARGHTLVELCPSTADVERYSLSPYIQARHILPLPWPRWERRIPFITPYLHAGANLAGAVRYHRRSREMARWLEGQSFDLLFAHDCSILLNPPIVGYARIPSLLYIHHGSHLSCEAGNDRKEIPANSAERLKEIYYRPAAAGWNGFRYWSEAWAARRATARACNSRLAQRLIGQAYGVPAQVVHFGVDAARFSPLEGGARSSYVLSAGAITPHKDFGFLLRSLGTLPVGVRPALRIASVHAEPEELAYLERLAAEQGVDFRVVHPASDTELVALYREAALFLFAAQAEAFGLVVVEAMACGTPVVGVQDGGYADSILDGVTGVLTPRSPEAFGQAVASLLQDPTKRQEMGRTARDQVLAYWNWERTVDELETLIIQTVGRRADKVRELELVRAAERS